jgi:hypothetical protein
MKIYSPTKTEYALPHNLYMQMIYLVRDYDRLCREINDIKTSIAFERPPMDDMPHASGTSDPTCNKAQRIIHMCEALHGQCRAVEQAMKCIPYDIRHTILDNIIKGRKYPVGDISEYREHRAKFLYTVAKNMGLI